MPTLGRRVAILAASAALIFGAAAAFPFVLPSSLTLQGDGQVCMAGADGALFQVGGIILNDVHDGIRVDTLALSDSTNVQLVGAYLLPVVDGLTRDGFVPVDSSWRESLPADAVLLDVDADAAGSADPEPDPGGAGAARDLQPGLSYFVVRIVAPIDPTRPAEVAGTTLRYREHGLPRSVSSVGMVAQLTPVGVRC